MIRVTLILALGFAWPGVVEAQNGLSQELARCVAVANDLERLMCYDALARAQSLDRPRERPVPTEGVGAWQIRDQANPNGSRAVSLALVATSGTSSSGQPIVLVLRCLSGETEVYLNWRNRLGSEAEIATRIGGDAVERKMWGLSSNQEASFYPGNDVTFINALMTGERFVAQVTPRGANTITAIFDTQGLDVAVKPMREACRW
jgi:type VI secretion system protein VasI